MIAFFDRHLRIGWANDRFASWFTVEAAALVGRDMLDVYGEAALAEAMPRLQRALAGEHVRYDRLLEQPGSQPKWIAVSLYPHRDDAGDVLGVFACSVEVDELKRTRDALDRSLQEISIYLENSPLAVIFGWTPAEAIGMSAAELGLVHPASVADNDAAMRELHEGRSPRNRIISRNITRDGRRIDCEWFHSAFVDAAGETRSVLSLAEDITIRMDAEEKLRHAATHDALTGCYNRRHLIVRLDECLAAARQTGESPALLFIDLDRFKPVNDQHGHAAGDALLKAVVARLRACARESDCIARLGGDEFVVLMPDRVDAQAPLLLRDRIRERLGRPFRINDLVLSIGASIGIARYPDDGESADALLRFGDETMYREKKAR